ncbi:MAG: aldolase [Alphaproteobacteria bacterium]|nr:aldolase [Alphaproteobacteria bacterium]
MRTNPVKARIAAGGYAYGTMLFEFFTPGIAQICKAAGAEFMLYDLEHSAVDYEALREQFSYCRGLGLVPMCRVPATQYDYISRALDAGSMGIMVPMVETEEQARFIVQSTRYPPIGRRGAAFGFAHDDFEGGNVKDKIKAANERTMVIALIETPKGIENVDKIAAVDGIDVCWVGHFDLTNFMGIPAEFDHPRFEQAITDVGEACRRHGKTAGFMSTDDNWTRRMLGKGVRLFACGLDIILLQKALRDGIASTKALVREQKRVDAKASRAAGAARAKSKTATKTKAKSRR